MGVAKKPHEERMGVFFAPPEQKATLFPVVEIYRESQKSRMKDKWESQKNRMKYAWESQKSRMKYACNFIFTIPR
jgi:hypothetical protein